MTSLELYHFPGSLCSQKVKLALAEKNIEWESRPINLLTFENLQPSYIRLNPKGVVPTLVDNGKIIRDSVAIIRYLEEQFPHPKLSPAELEPEMNDWIELQDRVPMREIMYGNMKGIDGIVSRRTVQIKEKLLPRLIQENPDLKEQYSAKLEDVNQWNQTIQNAEKVTQINTQIEPILELLENQLTQTKWLCGATYSLADIVWTAVLNRLEALRFDCLWAKGERQTIAAYLERLKARPSFKIIQSDTMPLAMAIAGLRRIFLGI